MNIKKSDPCRAADQQRNHLKNRLDFAPFVRRDDNPLMGRQHPQSGHHELPRQNDNDDPSRHEFVLRHHHECADHEDFIRKRIHQSAEIAFQMIFPCQKTIQQIRQRGENRHNVRDDMTHFLDRFTDRRNKKTDAVRPDIRQSHKHEDQQNPAECDPVREILQISQFLSPWI